MARSSKGLITHLRASSVGAGRIVENPGLATTFVGFRSEDTGRWGYMAVTEDGRGHLAWADTQVQAQEEVCEVLGLPPERVIGKRRST